MNKTAIKNFSVWAREKLIDDIKKAAMQKGISAEGIAKPLAGSSLDMQLFDIGLKDNVILRGKEITQRNDLAEAIRRKAVGSGYETAFNAVMEEIAYTWFNRLIAIRFMEVNDYLPSRVRVISSEISAKAEPDLVTSPFDSDLDFTEEEQDKILDMRDKNDLKGLFNLLFIKQCNKLHEVLPRLFEKTNDYTELLLNIDFTDKDGIIYHLVHDIPEESFNISMLDDDGEPTGQVEIIGWLYQYYNTALNEQVYDGTLSRSRIPKELLPAATTIYTPDWAVQYMVQNSLGRFWLEGHWNDSLQSKWKYYLNEAQQEADVEVQLEKIRSEYKNVNPENIRVIDPCMGSGHILVRIFDVLMQIYEIQGYSQRDAAQSILKNNLYGLDIDERAAQLAYFAVMMKARQYDRRIFNRKITPHVYAIVESNGLSAQWTKDSKQMKELFEYMKDAKEYGSILTLPKFDFDFLRQQANEKTKLIKEFNTENIILEKQLPQVMALFDAAEVLSLKYEIVITNPPYLGSSRFSPKLSNFVKENYPNEKADLSMVMLKRAIQGFSKKNGFISFITTSSWMTLSSFEKLRNYMFSNISISSLVDYGTELFDGKVGHNPIVSWVNRNTHLDYAITAIRLVDYCYSRREEKKSEFYKERNRYSAKPSNFYKIPGLPLAYWANDNYLAPFLKGISIDTISKYTGSQNKTANNDKYLRYFWEIYSQKIGIDNHWVFYAKGGDYRKHYGNLTLVVDWSEEARNFYKTNPTSNLLAEMYWYQEGITYTMLTSKGPNFRYMPPCCAFDMGGPAICYIGDYLYYILAWLNTIVIKTYLGFLNPTLNLQAKDVKALPLLIDTSKKEIVEKLEIENVSISKKDWDSYETSWDFKKHPLMPNHSGKIYRSWDHKNKDDESDDKNIPWSYSLKLIYKSWEDECYNRFEQLKVNEKTLNSIFIDIYGLQDELTPEVEDKYITIPKADLGRDIRSLISYAVGCMFGRYSLYTGGLFYAGGLWDYGTKVEALCDAVKATGSEHWLPSELFLPNRDNILLISDEEYFKEDIVSRFVDFIRYVYGKETLEENLQFIANALGGTGSPRQVIRDYFIRDFYKDHCKIYQKRPIYWLFDSGKKNGFKCLVYMHRWNADTAGKVRVDYLHKLQHIYEFEIQRMQETIDDTKNPREAAKAAKRKDKLQKQLNETKEYDTRLAHIALFRPSIDLDDGVKVNYEKVQTSRDGKNMKILAKI